MDFRDNHSTRIISVIVLSFFLWTFGGLFDIAYAVTNSNQPSAISAQNSSYQPSAVSNQQTKTTRPEAQFQKTIEGIEQILSDTTSDTDTKKNKLKTSRAAIEALDVELKKQFSETEKFLKDKGLPPEILERHSKFVKHYEDNLKELKTDLDNIDKAKDKAEFDSKADETKKFLDRVKPPKKHVPLDPNKLPHRTAAPVFKEPRTKPEEFTEGKELSAKGIAQKPILVAANGPLNGLISSPLPIADSQSPQLLAQATNLPTDADLSQTIEVKFTNEIEEIVELLNSDPVLVYEFVKNNFEYEPYYGSLKGSQQTLFEQAGNDFDQASLLIALYRSMRIPCRYVYGTIQVPIKDAISWVGAPDALTAIKILSTSGIPVIRNPEGIITALQMEHAWIEAFLPYDNYRGKINSIGNGHGSWIPLDPSFKQHFASPSGINLYQASDVSVEGILQTYASEIKTTLPVREYLSLIKSEIEQIMPDKRFYDLIWRNYIDKRELGLLPNTLEYEIIVTGYKSPEISDNLRHKVSFSTTGSLFEDGLSYVTSLPDIAGKRVTLSYVPATSTDEAIVAQFGNLYDTPPYMIQVKPVLKIEGQVKAIGGAIDMAVSHDLRLTLFMPNGKIEDIVTTPIIAGAYYAIGLDPQRTPSTILYQRADKYLQRLNFASNSTDRDEIVGEFLHLLVTGYLEQKDLSNKFIANTMQFRDFKKTTVAVLGSDLSVSYIFSIPLKDDVGQLFIDVQRDVSNPIDMSGSGRSMKDFMSMDGMNGSFLESSLFETVFDIDSISTLKALAFANSAGIPVYKITTDNATTYLPMLQISADVKTDIVNALNRNLQVTVPQRDIQVNQWKGVGYIIENPLTGEAAYLISGGLAGGSLTGVIANVKSMMKTGSITKAQALPYIKNLAEQRQIVLPHPLRGGGTIKSHWSPSRFHPILKVWRCHNGVDIGIPQGNDVIAVADGTATLTDRGTKSYGKYIVVNHGLGVYTLYGHLSQFKVSNGAFVKEGDLIGLSGNTGLSEAPHLHFSVIMSGDPNKIFECESSIDPELFIGIQ